jgi:phage/plasmid-like protein (TIGR03299 family)
MAHHFETGFFVGAPAWHGLGKVLKNAPTTREAIVAAGLDWEVLEAAVWVPLVTAAGRLATDSGATQRASRHKALLRSSDGRILSIVGADYKPLQNAAAFEFFDSFLHQGEAELESAGSLKEGEYVWVLARLRGGEGDVSKGDLVQSYLLLWNSHNGTTSVGVQLTLVRVVCWNTLSAARVEGETFGTVVKIRHDQNVEATLKALRETIDCSRSTFELTLDQYRAMRSRGLDAASFKEYVRKVFRPKEKLLRDAEEAAKAAWGVDGAAFEVDKDRLPRCYERIEQAFEAGPGAEKAGKTAFGAYNAVTHWLDHERGRSQDRRLVRSWFGDSRFYRQRAHDEALALV